MKTLSIVALVLFVSLISLCGISYAADSGLKIADTFGNVKVKAASAADWTDAAEGQALNPQDSIKTGANGKAKITFSDNSVVVLKPKTLITVDQLVWSDAKRDAALKLDIGSLIAKIEKHDTRSDFKVVTPVSICAVRGTMFFVGYENGKTDVAVLEGTVVATSFSPISDESAPAYVKPVEITITPNQSLTFAQGQEMPQTTTPIPQEESDTLKQEVADPTTLNPADLDTAGNAVTQTENIMGSASGAQQSEMETPKDVGGAPTTAATSPEQKDPS